MKIIPDLKKRDLPLLTKIYADDVRTFYNYFDSAFGNQKCNIITTVRTSSTYEGMTKDELGEILNSREPIKELQITAAQKFNTSGEPGTRALPNDPVYATLKLSATESSLYMIDPDDRKNLSEADLDGMKLKGFKMSVVELARKRLRKIDALISEAGMPLSILIGYALMFIVIPLFAHDAAGSVTLFFLIIILTAILLLLFWYLRRSIRSKRVIFDTKDHPEHRNLLESLKRYDREIVGAGLALLVEIVFALLVFTVVYLKDHLL